MMGVGMALLASGQPNERLLECYMTPEPEGEAAWGMMPEDVLAAQLAWLRKILKETGQSASRFAVAAGLTPSTLTRPLNNRTSGPLSISTMAKLSRAAGQPIPQLLMNVSPTREPMNPRRLMRARRAAEELFAGEPVDEMQFAEAQASIYDILSGIEEDGAEVTRDVLRAVLQTMTQMLRRGDVPPKGQD